jgi:hypothetical protein
MNESVDPSLQSLVESTIEAYPEISSRCEVDAIIMKLYSFGLYSLNSLEAVLSDDAMVPELGRHLMPSCPRAFVSLLNAQLLNAQLNLDDEGNESDKEQSDAAEKSDEIDALRPVPSFISRFMYALQGSVLEFMVPPDHMPWFKQHWIESRSADSATLKEEFMFLAELELLFGSLLFGALVGGFYGVMDETTIQLFKDMQVLSFGFWTATVGGLAVILAIMQVGISYLTIFIFLPVHPNNFYAFVKTKSVENFLNLGTVLIVISFYSLVSFLALAICNILGSSWLALSITFGTAFVVVFPIFIVLSTCTLNLAMWSGVYGPKKIVEDEVALSSDGRTSDDRLCRIALANIEKYGKPIPSKVLYCQTTKSDDEKIHGKKKFGKRSLRKKLTSHAISSHAHRAVKIGMF